MFKSRDIAAYILHREKSLASDRLQTLVFLAAGWEYAFTRVFPIRDEFEAHEFGVRVKSLAESDNFETVPEDFYDGSGENKAATLPRSLRETINGTLRTYDDALSVAALKRLPVWRSALKKDGHVMEEGDVLASFDALVGR